MEALFEIIKNEMDKHRVTKFHSETLLITVAPASSKTLKANNDFYFFAHAFSDSGIVSGRISGSSGGNVLDITPLTLNTKLHKFQLFKGNLIIINNNTAGKLFVEIFRVTPIPEIEKQN